MSKVTVQYKGDMLFEATAENHTVKIDVPPAFGGKDRGMNPTETFAVSLAACTSVLVVKYCMDMKLDPAGLTVDLTYDKLENPSRLGNFKAAIKIPRGGWESRKDGLLRAADRCPVAETVRQFKGMEITVGS